MKTTLKYLAAGVVSLLGSMALSALGLDCLCLPLVAGLVYVCTK